MRSALLLVLLLLLLLGPAATRAMATPLRLTLDPAHAVVGFRAYEFGLVPVDGIFTRFHGRLLIDPAVPNSCQVDVTVEVASLRMSDPGILDDTLSPGLLNAAAFSTLRYRGSCDGHGIAGDLTLHGVTRPLFLITTREGDRYRAHASLQRTDWGITGQPVLAGRNVRISVSTTVPAS
jgi:polyisoprenoid-binding protein YceI